MSRPSPIRATCCSAGALRYGWSRHFRAWFEEFPARDGCVINPGHPDRACSSCGTELADPDDGRLLPPCCGAPGVWRYHGERRWIWRTTALAFGHETAALVVVTVCPVCGKKLKEDT